MHRAERSAYPLQPCVNWPEVKFNAVIGFRLELVSIEVLYEASLPACTDGLLTSLASSVDFHMDYIVSLASEFGVVIDACVEDQVAWLQLFEFESDG